MKFHPFQPGRPSQRYGTYYSKVKEQALLYIQSNFKDGHDITKSLRDEQLVNLSSEMPKPQTSTKKDNNQHEAEQKMFDMRSITKEQLRKKAMDQWIALIAIRNSEPTKYSILKCNLNDDYSIGVDKFPTDLDSAVDILINHNKVFTRPKPPPGKPSPALKSKTTEEDTLAQEGTTTSFAQCFKCGSHDHLGPDCKQTKPTDEWWYATKAMKHYEEQTEKTRKKKTTKNSNT
jgi:hypothetical protein